MTVRFPRVVAVRLGFPVSTINVTRHALRIVASVGHAISVKDVGVRVTAALSRRRQTVCVSHSVSDCRQAAESRCIDGYLLVVF